MDKESDLKGQSVGPEVDACDGWLTVVTGGDVNSLPACHNY